MDIRTTILTIGLFAALFAGVLAILERIRNPNPKQEQNRKPLFTVNRENHRKGRDWLLEFGEVIIFCLVLAALHMLGIIK
jgi:hypothetical protein